MCGPEAGQDLQREVKPFVPDDPADTQQPRQSGGGRPGATSGTHLERGLVTTTRRQVRRGFPPR